VREDFLDGDVSEYPPCVSEPLEKVRHESVVAEEDVTTPGVEVQGYEGCEPGRC